MDPPELKNLTYVEILNLKLENGNYVNSKTNPLSYMQKIGYPNISSY